MWTVGVTWYQGGVTTHPPAVSWCCLFLWIRNNWSSFGFCSNLIVTYEGEDIMWHQPFTHFMIRRYLAVFPELSECWICLAGWCLVNCTLFLSLKKLPCSFLSMCGRSFAIWPVVITFCVYLTKRTDVHVSDTVCQSDTWVKCLFKGTISILLAICLPPAGAQEEEDVSVSVSLLWKLYWLDTHPPPGPLRTNWLFSVGVHFPSWF